MSDFSVVVPAVSSAAAATTEATERLAAHWRHLQAEVGDVLAGGWSGAAATAFEQAWAEWDAGARAVVTALGELSGRLADSGCAYASSDAAGTELFSRLTL